MKAERHPALGKRLVLALGAALVVVVAAATAVRAGQAAEPSHYDADSIDTAAHWAARATLANAVMLSGLGEPLELSMSRLDQLLKHAGYVVRPPMPEMALVGAVYAAGSPRLADDADFAKPPTLGWDAGTFDRTLDPGAQGWTLAKIASPGFHLRYHDRKEDRLAALLMLPQAQAQAEVLERRLLNPGGLFAARSPDGGFAEPNARDQVAVLWGVSNLILAATSDRKDYWHAAYRDRVDPAAHRALAGKAFEAVQTLRPTAPADRALAIEALGRYALTVDDGAEALSLAREHARALMESPGRALDDVALAVYGLSEADRLLGEDDFSQAAAETFRTGLLPLWRAQVGAFRTPEAEGAFRYTPLRAGAVAAALNAMRWHAPDAVARQAAEVYPRFLETVLVDAGLQLASPLPLVPAEYRQAEPDAHFAHPALPAPGAVGLAPVFASAVRRDGDGWQVTDERFRTAGAMFLANMLAGRHAGQADPFLPGDRLGQLR